MTLFGHIGGGLLVAGAAEKLMINADFSAVTLGIVVFLSILPDLDGILAYLFRKWKPGVKRLNHHDYFTHTPILYLCLSIAIWFGIGKDFSILFILLIMTHLILDSWGTDDGIMWLWPASKRKFSILARNLHEGGLYGMSYYRRYICNLGSSLPEVLLFMGGLVSVFVWWK